jgi:hypothetical protein
LIKVLFPGFVLFPRADRSSLCADAADANDDGIRDFSDVLDLGSFLFSGGPPPPAPFPDCGPDPTPDGLSCLAFAGCE